MGFKLPVITPSNREIPVHDPEFPLEDMTLRELFAIVGGLSEPSKMPGYAYSLSAWRCKVGSIMANVEGSICQGCYAKGGNYIRFPAVQEAMERRYQSLYDPRWTAAFVRILHRILHNDVFRWFDSGDIQSKSHLQNTVNVAIRTPKTRHWIPTREYQIIDEWLRENGSFPPNLTVRVSGQMKGDAAPSRYTVSSGVLPEGMSVEDMRTRTGREFQVCPAYTQGGQCLDCRSCWDQSIAMIVYPEH